MRDFKAFSQLLLRDYGIEARIDKSDDIDTEDHTIELYKDGVKTNFYLQVDSINQSYFALHEEVYRDGKIVGWKHWEERRRIWEMTQPIVRHLGNEEQRQYALERLRSWPNFIESIAWTA